MITLVIIGITVLISLLAMNDNDLKGRFMFNAYAISHHKQWYRFLTHGLLHADYEHLIFNMLSLLFFGFTVEGKFCKELFGMQLGIIAYVGLYISALFFSSIYTYLKEKDNKYYNALGASGAVSAVVFASILIDPLRKMGLMLIPVMIPAWIFGTLYLIYSWYRAKRKTDNVGHEAHFFGAIYGFFFPIILHPELWFDFIGHIRSSLMYLH